MTRAAVLSIALTIGVAAAAAPPVHFTQSVAIGDRVIAIGSNGLFVLDAAALTTRGQAVLSGTAVAVDAVAAFAMDLNGDGAIGGAETFDLAVVAVGDDATVQLFRIPVSGNPETVAVVRLASAPTSVRIDGARQIVYVGVGPRGVAMIDLQGPASIQPIDLDRNGVDDRLLGITDTPGEAGGLATIRRNSVGVVADGPSGVTAMQLQPAGTTFVSLQRDPMLSRTGDEQDILESRQALTSDAAIRVTVDAAIPPQTKLLLQISETTLHRLSFTDGTTAAALADGVNELALAVAPLDLGEASEASLQVVTEKGEGIASIELEFVAFDPTAVSGLEVSPDPIEIGSGAGGIQIEVAGRLADGRIANLTRDPSTTYASADPRVAAVDTAGFVTAVAGGATELAIASGRRLATVAVRSNHLPRLTEFELARHRLTLTAPGQKTALGVVARFSDGVRETDVRGFGIAFSTSDATVATVDADGSVTAVGNGTATITIRQGAAFASVQLAVEFRTVPTVTAIQVAPFSGPQAADGRRVGRATVSGTGSLEGLPVTFEIVGQPSPAQGNTDYSGTAMALLRGLTSSGSFVVRASVTNPSGGNVLTAETPITVATAGVDLEPNDTTSTAALMRRNRVVAGRLGNGDARDMYRLESTVPGNLGVTVGLQNDAQPASVRLIFLAADSTELSRFTLSSHLEEHRQAVASGPTFIVVETLTGAAVAYSIQTRFDQAAITIASVTPQSGGPGTAVTITGTGFSLDASETFVYVGGAMARLTQSSPTELRALVPAFAIDGPLEVVSLARRATGPSFAVGVTTRPPVTMSEGDVTNLREDPVSGFIVDVTRLIVYFDPTATPASVQTIAAGLGGVIVGTIPVLNAYVLDFAASRTVSGIETIARALRANPTVRRINRDVLVNPAGQQIDSRDAAGNWPGTTILKGIAYQQARVFEAIEAIRQTPPHDVSGGAFESVSVAVIDTGFNPARLQDAQFQGHDIVSRMFAIAGSSQPWTPRPYRDLQGHGTKVSAIIGAVNNGSGMSGAMNGVFRAGEQPVSLTVYSIFEGGFQLIDGQSVLVGGLSDALIQSAMADSAALDFHVVNMSFGAAYRGPSTQYEDDKQTFRELFALGADRTLYVVAAGNDGLDAQFMVPAALADELPFVMSIGATAVADLDGSGEGADARAIFNGTLRSQSIGIECRQGVSSGESNCGDSVTLAAPGEDILTLRNAPIPNGDTVSPFIPGADAEGTSFAAPMVSAVAALLQLIRGNSSAFAPDALRDLLVESGDDITGIWTPGPMRRLNALRAVRSVLPPLGTQMIYAADQEAENSGAARGRIVAIGIDPLTGNPIDPPDHKAIPLTFTTGVVDDAGNVNFVSFEGTEPTSAAVSPAGDRLYVVVNSVSPALGHGVLVVNTLSNQPENFIAFSGAVLGGNAPPGTSSGAVTSLRPGLVVSRDGRLAYAATGTAITILDLVDGRVVREFVDLPAAYRSLAGAAPERLSTRTARLSGAVQSGVSGKHGVAISALALSEDGRVLYAAVSTGGGAGIQPGGLLAIDVDLYTDGEGSTRGLQSKLDSYFKLITPSALPATNGDEPQTIAVAGDFVYVVNGGLNLFITSSATVIPEPGVIDEPPDHDESVTVLSARGVTNVFRAAKASPATPPAAVSDFPGNVMFGWGPDTAGGGPVTSQNQYASVFAGRPFAMAVNPSGRRAIVANYQTGNFSVLDLTFQNAFGTIPPSNMPPSFMSLPVGAFHAVVAVTQALQLDDTLFPNRGAFSGGTLGARMPSPDENLLFPWAIEYAQNGRFAAATHVGVGKPRPVTVPLPDFNRDEETGLFRLSELGFAMSGTTARAPDGTVYAIGEPVKLFRGGGALSIVSDTQIKADFSANITRSVLGRLGDPGPPFGHARPYYTMTPVCHTSVLVPPSSNLAGANLGRGQCVEPVVQTITQYSPAATAVEHLTRPRGIAIQPFIYMESPRFGDSVTSKTFLEIGWRDLRVDAVQFEVFDLDQLDGAGNPTPIPDSFGFPFVDLANRHATIGFGDLFPATQPPVQGRRYRVSFSATTSADDPSTGDKVELSSDVVELTFDDRSDPIHVSSKPMELRPALLPVRTLGDGHQLKVTSAVSGSTTEITAQATFAWTGGSSDAAVPPLTIDLSPQVAEIESKLAGPPFGAFSFSRAQITISHSGLLTATAPGIELVQAVFDGDSSELSVVLAGFTLVDATIEPQPSGTTLTARIQNAIGKGHNAPLVLSSRSNSFVDDIGHVALEDAVLRYVDGRTIHLAELMDVVREVIGSRFAGAIGGAFAPIGATPAWRHAQAVNRLQLVDDAHPLPIVMGLDSTAASAQTADEVPFQGLVSGLQPGLAAIIGTVDLGGFGTVQDSLLAWTLSPLATVALEPSPLVIRTIDPVTPGPTIVSVATTTPQSTVFQVPGSSAAEALAKTLPTPAGPFSLSLGSSPTFTLSGDASADAAGVHLTDFVLRFPVPTGSGSSITSAYTIADPTIAVLGSAEPFAQHVQRRNSAGGTRIENSVAADGLGSSTGSGLIVVTDCTSQALLAVRLLSPATVNEGDTIHYVADLVNLSNGPMPGITIDIEQRIGLASAHTASISAGALQAGESGSYPFDVTAPFGGGSLSVNATAPGFCAGQAPPVTVVSTQGAIIITEMVLKPVQDWNDSSGGNGVPFDPIPGNGTVDGDDVWIELLSGTTSIQSWVVELRDATGATFSKTIGPPIATRQTRLLTGFGVGSSPIVSVRVIDGGGLVRQTLDIQAIDAALGPATSPVNESLTWSFSGTPSPLLQQFIRRAATINAFIP